MSYDIFIVTADVDGNRVNVPIAESQFGSLSPLYAAAIPGIKSVKDLDVRSCREVLPSLEAGLIALAKDPERFAALAMSEWDMPGDEQELIEVVARTVQTLVREASRRPSGFVRVVE